MLFLLLNADEIGTIRGHLNTGLTPEEITIFFSWLNYRIRCNLEMSPFFAIAPNYESMCSAAGKLTKGFLKQLEVLKYSSFSIYVKTATPFPHEITIAVINAQKHNQKMQVPILIDPTFIQFCTPPEETSPVLAFYDGDEAAHPGTILSETEAGLALGSQLMN